MGGQQAMFDQPDAGMPRPFGKYTLLTRLATGGMADVFVALLRADFGFEKLVVIKCLLPSLATDQRHVAMFLDEARTAATLTHPSIVQMFDAGEVDGAYYIAMEYIEGRDLRSLLRELHARGQPGLPLEHAVFVMTKILSGLEYAHQKRDFNGNPLRIVHRDISPQNVVITFSGDVKIVDFGVAKSTMQLGEKTEVGQLKGKVAYMSPEQARGQPIDWRSDLFSCGVVLFELTTGTRLFRGANEVETLRRIYSGDVPAPSKVKPGYPAELEAIVGRALAKDRRTRYQSAREMQADLELFAQRAGVPISDVAFEHWVEGQLHDARQEQEVSLQRIRKLAASLSKRPPASERPAQSKSVPPPPPVIRLAAVESSRPPPPDLVATTGLDAARTLRGSVHSVPPPEVDPFRPPKRFQSLRTKALALAAVVTLIALAATPAAGKSDTAWVRQIHGYVSDWIVKPLSRGFNQLIGDDPPAQSQPVTGSLEVRTSVVGASVEVDGKRLNGRPVINGLVPGSKHRVKVTATGYKDTIVDVTAKPGKQTVGVKLDPATP